MGGKVTDSSFISAVVQVGLRVPTAHAEEVPSTVTNHFYLLDPYNKSFFVEFIYVMLFKKWENPECTVPVQTQ